MRLTAVLALGALAACAPRVRPDYPEPENTDDPMALMPDAGPRAAGEAPPPPLEPRAAAGQIRRAALNDVLDSGIGAFLAGVQVDPAFERDKFFGWEVVSFWPDDPRFARVDLVPGDIVKNVNGLQVERPEQVQALWESLRTAESITVQVFRNGAVHELRYLVVP